MDAYIPSFWYPSHSLSPLPSQPSGSSQSPARVELSVLVSRFSAASYFHDRVCMSIPTSRFFPPPFPTALHSHLCSLHLCLYPCPANGFICTIFLEPTYMFFSFCFTSLFRRVSRSIHISTNDSISFLLMVE